MSSQSIKHVLFKLIFEWFEYFESVEEMERDKL